MRYVWACVAVLVSVLVSGCAGSGKGYVYKLYPGPPRAPHDLSLLRLGEGATAIQVDGLRVGASDYEAVELLPGEHEVRWSQRIVDPAMVGASAQQVPVLSLSIELRAGRDYTVRVVRGEESTSKTYLWVEDTATGTRIAGASP